MGKDKTKKHVLTEADKIFSNGNGSLDDLQTLNHHENGASKDSTCKDETTAKADAPVQNGESAEPIYIRDGDDFSDVQSPVKLTKKEFAFDIWLFEFDLKGKPYLKGIYRDGIIKKLNDTGYYKRCRENNTYLFIREQSNIISNVELYQMKDEVFGYVKNIPATLQFDYCKKHITINTEKIRETFLRQSHTVFNKTFLEHLPTHTKLILRDTKDTAFFFFSNQIIKVTANRIESMEYAQISDECIWREHIIEHAFEYILDNSDCHFARFIRNVTNNEPDRYSAFISAIGYLLQNSFDPAEGQSVIAYDEDVTDLTNPMGGTGKGIFANAIRQMRDMEKIDGRNINTDSQFKFQKITESTQVVWLDDVNPKIGFEIFYSCLTDGWIIEKKFRDEFYIKPEDSPKMFLTCNAVLKGGGISNIRRQFIIEFSNHYSQHIKLGNETPVKDEHCCIFYGDDWKQSEWNKFYSFMLDCVCFYLKNGLQTYKHRNVHKNKLIQSTSEDFYEWVETQNFQPEVEYNTMELFENFRNIYYGESSDFKQRGFTLWLKKVAKAKGWEMKIKRSNSVNKFLFRR